MGEIVNLRGRRKQKRREEAARAAADNRARFGRTRAEITRDASVAARLDRALDGARLDTDDTVAQAAPLRPGAGRES